MHFQVPNFTHFCHEEKTTQSCKMKFYCYLPLFKYHSLTNMLSGSREGWLFPEDQGPEAWYGPKGGEQGRSRGSSQLRPRVWIITCGEEVGTRWSSEVNRKVEIGSEEGKRSQAQPGHLPDKPIVTRKVLGQAGMSVHGAGSRSAGPMARQRLGCGWAGHQHSCDITGREWVPAVN